MRSIVFSMMVTLIGLTACQVQLPSTPAPVDPATRSAILSPLPMETSVPATSTREIIETSTRMPDTARNTTPSPPTKLRSGQWAYLFYHPSLERVILVNGGPDTGKDPADPLELWSWSGTVWEKLPTGEPGPAWRNFAAAAYDVRRSVLVIHGGVQNRRKMSDTWEWDGTNWKGFSSPGPGPLEGALMTYDEARGRSVLYGGAGESLSAKTWNWDGHTWTENADLIPQARFPGGMVYDPIRQEVWMYSGHSVGEGGDFVTYDDLWSWNGETWRQVSVTGPTPGMRTHTSLLFDHDAGRVLLFGGGLDQFMGDLWAWDGSHWEEIPVQNMPARSGPALAYDQARDRFILFGGVDRPGGTALSDTWEWDGVSAEWMCVYGCE